MLMKKNSHISPHKILFLLFLLICSTAAKAQFKIVDEQDGKPVAGAYVFSSTGSLLCISDADGNIKKLDGTVTISNLSYEPKSIDASKTTGVVYMRQKAYTLPEVTIGKADYVKLSGAFRDICRNDGKTILYRERLMDFYINTASGKIKRRVRACRQYEARGLRKIVNFKIAILGMAQSTDLSRIKYIKRDTINNVSGDTTFYKSSFKGHTSDNAIMYIDTHREGIYRHIIDNAKYRTNINPMLKVHTNLCDWTFSSKAETWNSLVSFRSIFNYDQQPLPGKNFISAEEMRDFVVTDAHTLPKEQADKELKDKTETADFRLPDCLPALPYDVTKETQGLELKKFWEM